MAAVVQAVQGEKHAVGDTLRNCSVRFASSRRACKQLSGTDGCSSERTEMEGAILSEGGEVLARPAADDLGDKRFNIGARF